MARSVPWQRTCNDVVFWRQTQALNATIYILRETGPTGFLLKEEGETKPCKAFLGDPHSCTCTQFMKDRDLCKHICWLLLKKFRVPQTNPMSWQKGLVEREINEILRGLTQQQRKKVPTAVARWRRPLSAGSDAREVIPQRDIAEDDVCPICQDELLAKRLPVTYCKFGCGNSIHIKCMKVWAEHQKSQGETTVKCPFCREDFGPFEMLKYENRNAEGAGPGGRMDRHLGTTCQSCRISPIEGKCYRCSVCADFHLCQSCFNTPIHTQHPFEYRHKRNQRWRAAGRAYGAVLPQAVVDDLVNREISDNDYDLLMQLDNNAQATGSDIPEEVVQSFPLEKVRQNGPLLQPGVQCRICLHGYQLGQFVRRLPRCKHKFHRDCIDAWLLHSRPTCPIDGLVVWDRISAQLEEEQNNKNKAKKRQSTEPSAQSAGVVNLEIPGIGIAARQPEPNDSTTRTQTRVPGRAPLRRQPDRADREAVRVLGALQNNFAISGTALASDSDSTMEVPGGRLLNRASQRRAALNQHVDNYQTVEENMAVQSSTIESENIDPLDEVAAANLDNCHDGQGHSQRSEGHGLTSAIPGQKSNHVLQERQLNHSSIFASGTANNTHDATATLLSNMARLSPYREMPNGLSEAMSRQVMEETSRSDEIRRNYEGQRSRSLGGLIPDVPPERRLFADTLGTDAGSSHLMFDPNAANIRGSNSSNQSLKQQRQQMSVNSAPAAGNPERGRQAGRGWSQSSSMHRNRSNSRERPRDQSRERPMNGLGTGTIPKEGENLLERLTLFTDLYLGNSPRSHPAVSGNPSGLPPRPSHRPRDNHAAARLRRFQNEHRRNNFSLEGNACTDLTLRDLIG